MKRKQMLEDLEDFLIDLMESKKFIQIVEINGHKELGLINNPEEAILDFIESKGMLPPDIRDCVCCPPENKWEDEE